VLPSSPPRRVQPPRESFWHRLRKMPIGRPLGVVASLVTVLALVLGGAVYLSQDSLPGDTLYGLKRTSERVELSWSGSDTDRAHKLLEFATTRVDESRRLVSRPSASAADGGPLADGRLSPQTTRLVSDTLASADDDTRTASRLLGAAAVKQASAAPLADVSTWASGQLARLTRLRESIPTSATARTKVTESATLVRAVATRAGTLQKRVACDCLRDAPSDSLGPVPVSTPKAPQTTAPGTSGKRSGPSTTATSTSGPRQPATTRTTGGSTGRTTARPKASPLPLPSIPALLPTTTHPPLLDLCKVTLLGIRLCPSTSP
jgi:hypothetical protein